MHEEFEDSKYILVCLHPLQEDEQDNGREGASLVKSQTYDSGNQR